MQISSHPLSEEQLMAYFDGELSANEAATAAAHLQHCRECQALAADLQSVSRHLSAWQVDPPSPALTESWERSLQALIPKKLPKKNPVAWLKQHAWSFGFIPIAVVLLVAVPISFFRQSAPHREYDRAAPSLMLRIPASETSSRFHSDLTGGAGGVVGGNLQAMKDAAPPPPPARTPTPSGPLIIRTARLSLTTTDFAHVRESISSILSAHAGYIAQLEMNTPADEARSLEATLRIPAAQLDETLTELKRLGHVDSESQHGEEVTQRVIDVQARLSNLRTTEARLTDILRQRTGKLADVLAVEEQIGSVRGQIETTEAEQKSLAKQIDFAAVQLKVSEEYKKSLTPGPISTGTRLRNAFVDGFQTLADAVVGFLLFLLSYGPVLLVIGASLFFPARAVWRYRRQRAI